MNTVIRSVANRRSTIMATKKIVYPAADRNKEPILQVLLNYIRRDSDQTFLEISSGTGQHVAYFAPHFPRVTFYPSEYDASVLESIVAYTREMPNVKPPQQIDVSTDFHSWGDRTFKEASFDYIYNSNLIQVSPYKCTTSLFNNAGKLLKNNGLLIMYGPFAINGIITPESNVEFDKSLKFRNPEWGIRDLEELKKLAEKNGIKFVDIVDMPANNKTVIWKKCT